jgi:radical SAM superfamily enzyme YgiQ (UPF0313 family)
VQTLLINPETDVHNNWLAESIALRGKKVLAPPLGLLTAAALLPGEWECRLVDAGIRRVTEDDWQWADVVMFTGNFLHQKSLLELIPEAKRRGKRVVVGGPYVSSDQAEALKAGADIVVAGESENVMPQLIEALKTGQRQEVFQADEKPDMSASPLPRYDLLTDMAYYNFMSVQTTRGCPFNCEFCDVIALNGRVPRFKTPGQVISELEHLHRLGWRGQVFVADDNFIGNKQNAREILLAMIRWQEDHGKPYAFFTQVSANLGQDRELIDLMTAARFSTVLVGVETPDEEILSSVRKTQNIRNPLLESIANISTNGLSVVGTLMLGFDGETKGAGQRIANLVEKANLPIALLSTLTVIPRTSLWDRLEKEGRLIENAEGFDGWMGGHTNFVPTRPASEIHDEFVGLWEYLYEPSRFLARVYRCYLTMRPTRKAMAQAKGGRPPVATAPRPWDERLRDLRAAFFILWIFGVRSRARLQFWKQAVGMLRQNPSRMIQYINDCALGLDMFRIRDTLIKSKDAVRKGSDVSAA